jgi:hypothetical protein
MTTIDDRINPVGQQAGRIVAVEQSKAEQGNSSAIALSIARCQASPGVRMRSSPMVGFEK